MCVDRIECICFVNAGSGQVAAGSWSRVRCDNRTTTSLWLAGSRHALLL